MLLWRKDGFNETGKFLMPLLFLSPLVSDPTFADVRYGKFVPYATAGDCYSSASCPQGRFHINLICTQLALAPEVDWGTEGYAVSKRLARDEVNIPLCAYMGFGVTAFVQGVWVS